MSAKPLADRSQRAPVAGPPVASIKIVTVEGEAADAPTWSFREWISSLILHGFLLLAMAFWYFHPPSNPPKTLNTRLMGSEFGLEDGMFPTGGLNTPIELTQIDLTPPEPLFEYVPLLDPVLTKLKPKPKAKPEPKPETTDTPTAGGGLDTPNPGAGAGDGFGVAKFGDGGESIQGIQVKVGDPQFTLIWDSEADLDLHVIEPGGKEINWEHPEGDFGGQLDVDNSKGYGPENIFWMQVDPATGEKVKGKGPTGEYQWFVKFWGGLDGKIRPTGWKVRVKHAGKVEYYTGRFRVLNEKSKIRSLKVEGPAAPTPPVEPDKDKESTPKG